MKLRNPKWNEKIDKPLSSVIFQPAHLEIEEQAADHEPRAALAGLAVHHDYVVHVALEPIIGAVAEGLEQREGGAVMVLEGEARNEALEESAVVEAFGAQVENLALAL